MAGLKKDQLALYTKDMYKAERETYKEIETKYDKVYSVKTGVKGSGDKVTQLLGASGLVRHTVENQDINFRAPVQGWEFLVKYHTYSDGLTLSKEAVEDTVKLGNLLKELAGTWGKQVRVAKETLGALVFNKGGDLLGEWVFNGTHTGQTDSSGDMMYDSEPLFNLTGNTRATKNGGTYYNSIASLTLNPENFETLYNLHVATNNRDERDIIVQNPCDSILVQAGADRFTAERIFFTPKTQGVPNSTLNDINPYYGIIKNIIDWDYLNDTSSPFYIGKARSSDFQFHERQAPEIRFFRDEVNRSYKASIDIRIGILLKNWRTWSRGGGTSD